MSVQLSKLEQWGVITSVKKIDGKKTRTTYEITDYGICTLKEYVELLKRVIMEVD